MRNTQVAFSTKLDFQCQLIEIELKKLFNYHHEKKQINVDWEHLNIDHIELTIDYPLHRPSERFKMFESLTKFERQFDKIRNLLLPNYFGTNIELNQFDLMDETLRVSFDIKDFNLFLLDRLGFPVDVHQTQNDIPLEAMQLGNLIDNIIGESGVDLLYRLPSGIMIWNHIRLREAVYTIDYYRLGKSPNAATMIGLKLIKRGMGRKGEDRLGRLVGRMEQYLENDERILDYSVSYSTNLKALIEVRAVV